MEELVITLKADMVVGAGELLLGLEQGAGFFPDDRVEMRAARRTTAVSTASRTKRACIILLTEIFAMVVPR